MTQGMSACGNISRPQWRKLSHLYRLDNEALCKISVHVIAPCDCFAHAQFRIGEALAVRADCRDFSKLVGWHNHCALHDETSQEESL